MRAARQSRFHRTLEPDTSLDHWSPDMKSLLTIVTGATALPVLAHEGHGLFGAHWHATDALGFVAAAGLIGLVVWLSKK
jgi:hypothetical protein